MHRCVVIAAAATTLSGSLLPCSLRFVWSGNCSGRHSCVKVFLAMFTEVCVMIAAAYTTVYNCVKATLATNGYRGPFQGLGPTLVRNIPANAIYLGSFEVMKGKLAERRGCKKTELPAAYVISAGGAGGILYWLSIYPIDVIKSAMATDALEPSKRKYPDMATTYKVELCCGYWHAL